MSGGKEPIRRKEHIEKFTSIEVGDGENEDIDDKEDE